MKTMKNLSLALLTFACLVFVVPSTFAQKSAKIKPVYGDKPVYQINITANCGGKTASSSGGPSDCDPELISISAGLDDVVCSSQSYELSGTSPKNVKIFWKTSGDGSFDDPTRLDAVYTPGMYDKLNGIVILFLHALPTPNADEEAKFDSMMLTFQDCVGVEDQLPEN